MELAAHCVMVVSWLSAVCVFAAVLQGKKCTGDHMMSVYCPNKRQ